MNVFLSVVFSLAPFFQTITTDITRSLNEGNTVGLSSFLDAQVEVSIADFEAIKIDAGKLIIQEIRFDNEK